MTVDEQLEPSPDLQVPVGKPIDLELSAAIPSVSGTASAADGRIHFLARLHGRPVGMLAVPTRSGGVGPIEIAAAVQTLLPAVNRHLADDGLGPVDVVEPAGVRAPGRPPCDVRRQAILREAPPMTVLIATRDRPESLRRCLTSIARLDPPAHEVLVVDSAPTDDRTGQLVRELHGSIGTTPLRYMRETRPGLAIAHNRGLAHIRDPWVAITDDDVEVDPSWLAAIAEAACSAPAVACVTGLILPAELATRAQVLVEQSGGFSRGFVPRLFDLGIHRPQDPLFPLAAGRLGSGANMAFRVDVLRRIGGFDPALGAGTIGRGGDDLAAFLAVVQSGHSVAYAPSAVVRHHHRRDIDGLHRQARHYGVGLGAYLTAAAVHEPRLMATMLTRLGPGVRHLVGAASPKNAAKPADFPRELHRAERWGVLRGPGAYMLSRLRHRLAR